MAGPPPPTTIGAAEDEEAPGSGRTLAPSKSALATEEILEHLLGFLSVSDLCSARQVCTLWNEEGVRHLRKRSPPIELGYPPLLITGAWRRLTPDEFTVRTRNFFACAQSSADFPFTQVDMTKPLSSGLPVDIWQEAMISAAPWLTSLILNDNQPVPEFRPGTLEFPKLDKLSVTGFTPALLLQVVENAPRLSTLKFTERPGLGLSYLPQLSQLKRRLQLKELYLILNYDGDGESPEQLEEEHRKVVLHFLESQRHSLQTLNLQCYCGNLNAARPNFIFPKLETLSLRWEWTGDRAFQGPVEYVHTFPKLRSLRLHSITDPLESLSWGRAFGSGTCPSSSSVSTLRIHCDDAALQTVFFENAPRTFAQVTRVEIEQYEGVVWRVGELLSAFRKLEELSLCVERISDLVMSLTGEPEEEECARVAQLTGEPLREMELEWRRRMEEERERYKPFQRLRALRIRFVTGNMIELPESLARLLTILTPNLKLLHLLLRWGSKRGPRPLPSGMAALEGNTTIIFN